MRQFVTNMAYARRHEPIVKSAVNWQNTNMTPPLTRIQDLPNLGPKSAEMLARAGIGSRAALKKLGAVEAYRKVKAIDGRASLNLLWALAAALSDPPRHWRDVAREDRLTLLLQLDESETRQKPHQC